MLVYLLLTFAFFGQCYGITPASLHNDGVHIYNSLSQFPRDSITKEEFEAEVQKINCLSGSPVPAEGIFVTTSNRKHGFSSSFADIVVTGDCPEGFTLSVPKTTNVECSFSTGWIDGPTCVPITCANVFSIGIESSNCTSGDSFVGDRCALFCTDSEIASSGTPIAECGSLGWETDFYCASQLFGCGSGVTYMHGVPGSLDDILDVPAVSLEASWATSAIKHIATTNGGNCIVESDDTLKCMGRNSMGEVAGSAAHTAVANPFSYSAFVGQNIVQFESDMHHLALRLENGEVYTWGYSMHHQTLQPTTGAYSTPTIVNTGGKATVDMIVGPYATALKLDDGTFYGGGYGTFNPFKGTTAQDVAGHTMDVSVASGTVTKVYLRHSGSIMITDTGEYYGRGSQTRSAQFCISAPTTATQAHVKGNDGVGLQGKAVEAHCNLGTCAILANDGEVYLCSLDTITVDGVAASGGTPRSITSAVNTGCSSGKRNKLSSTYYGIAFFGTCPGTYGIIQQHPKVLCSTTAPEFTLSEITSLPGTYRDLSINFEHALAVN